MWSNLLYLKLQLIVFDGQIHLGQYQIAPISVPKSPIKQETWIRIQSQKLNFYQQREEKLAVYFHS